MKVPGTIVRFMAASGGASAVEFALVVPAVLLMLFGAVGGGVLAYATVSLQRATEIAARCMSMDRSDLCASGTISTYGTSVYSGPQLQTLTFVANKVSCGYKITGSGTFSAFPGLDFLSVNLHANACYPGIRP